ncbi:MAG TPA: hypothetical protein EYH08_00620 [Pyrodictium sp.]|nr:hypothetical protein [Pyrodictium sp.]
MRNRESLIDQVRELLEKEIEQLEQRLQLYQLLLSILDACREKGLAGFEVLAEFKHGNIVIARILKQKEKLILEFTRPMPKANPYIKYLLKRLSQLQEAGSIEYEVEESAQGIHRIVAKVVDEEALEDTRIDMEFVANKLATLYTRQSKAKEQV